MVVINLILSILLMVICFSVITLSIPYMCKIIREHVEAEAFSRAEVYLGLWLAACIFLFIFFIISIAWLWKHLPI